MSNHLIRVDALTDPARLEPLRSVENFSGDFHFNTEIAVLIYR